MRLLKGALSWETGQTSDLVISRSVMVGMERDSACEVWGKVDLAPWDILSRTGS